MLAASAFFPLKRFIGKMPMSIIKAHKIATLDVSFRLDVIIIKHKPP